MASVTKPIMLDETGQKIVDAILNTEAKQQAIAEIQKEGATQVANVRTAAGEYVDIPNQISQLSSENAELKGDIENNRDVLSISQNRLFLDNGIYKSKNEYFTVSITDGNIVIDGNTVESPGNDYIDLKKPLSKVSKGIYTFLVIGFTNDSSTDYGGMYLYDENGNKLGTSVQFCRGKYAADKNYKPITIDNDCNAYVRFVIPKGLQDFTWNINVALNLGDTVAKGATMYTSPEITYIDKGANFKIDKILNVFQLQSKYRYLVLTFLDTSQDGLVLLGTNNLKTFHLVARKGLYKANKSSSVRDPAIILIDDWYYITYTTAGTSTSTDIAFCRTKNFVDFEELDNIALLNNGEEFYQIWAPAWYRENDEYYIIFSGRMNSSESFTTFLCRYYPETHTIDSIFNTYIKQIDAHICKENGIYYMLAGGGHIYKSPTLVANKNTYEQIIDTNLNYEGYEANFPMQKDDGSWIMYMQQLLGTFGTAHQVYVEAKSLDGQWTDPKEVNYSKEALDYAEEVVGSSQKEYIHWTIYDWNKMFSNNNNN